MTDLKRFLNEGWVLATLLLVCFGGGVFGAVNWNDYVDPSVPERGSDPYRGITEPQETYDLRVAEYHRKVEEVGKSALIPFPLAVTLCLTSFFGVAVFLFALLIRARRGKCDELVAEEEYASSVNAEFGVR